MTLGLLALTFSVFLLYWTYDGYFRVCEFMAGRWGRAPSTTGSDGTGTLPRVAVVVAARNEVECIAARIDNILSSDYPAELLALYVGSDHSTDGTDDVVRSFEDRRVRLVVPSEARGKSDVQNEVIAQISDDILVFTDADTVFEPDTISRLVAPLADPMVGCVTGRLRLRGSDGVMSEGHGRYWTREMQLRAWESSLGILAVATGACMAVRRRLMPCLDACVGEDCEVPLAVAQSGYGVVHQETAVAWDAFAASSGGEFRARTRMTERNWRGTWRYPKLLNVFIHPGYAAALWSHKLLRWLSPACLAGAVGGSWLVARAAGYGYAWMLAASCLMLSAILGAATARLRVRLEAPALLFGFLLANCGFALGVWRAVVFRCRTGRYR